MKKITLLMTTWNAFDHVKFTINSLFANTNNFSLIIFDNGSNSDVVNFLKKLETEKDNVRVIYSPENVGVWKSRFEASQLVDTDLMGIIDSDIAFQKNWLETLSEYFQDSEVGQVGPTKLFSHLIHPYTNLPMHLAWREVEKSNPNLNDQIKKYLNDNSFRNFIQDLWNVNGYFNEEISIPPHCISGCCMLTRTNLYKSPKVVDVEYAKSKYGFEDMDYSWKLKELGYKVLISNKVYVHHFEHSSVDENQLNINAPDQQYNTLYFYQKWEETIVDWIISEKEMGKSLQEIQESFIINILYKTIPKNIPTKLLAALKDE
ncbi:glycosyltransferase family 2 protein [Candidatus Dojkabacteria bacterium]|uniref:Glycosyltransferase family 2 protein n=1 Tax=Candidatus Dojkabacteria bacterium TaxID=2099670 RepID=A0A955LBY9_9BACT|nr:glycosyltransferase family 2 protein [Candidatus Dojkabacteria bacterium]